MINSITERAENFMYMYILHECTTTDVTHSSCKFRLFDVNRHRSTCTRSSPSYRRLFSLAQYLGSPLRPYYFVEPSLFLDYSRLFCFFFLTSSSSSSSSPTSRRQTSCLFPSLALPRAPYPALLRVILPFALYSTEHRGDRFSS